MSNIFEFIDYRAFLKSYYQEQKLLQNSFSYAVMAEKANISSRGLLKLIMDGKRNLSLSNVENMVVGLGFNKIEASYFTTLVLFNQSKGFEEKNRLYEKLMKFPQKQKVSVLKLEQYNLFSKWYYSAMHELIQLSEAPQGEKEFCEWVVEKLKGKITLKEVLNARKEMIALGLLSVMNGRLVQSNKYVESQSHDEINFALQKFHRQMITESLQALDKHPSEREFGGVTLAFKKSDLIKAKDFIREFRKKFNFDFTADNGADSVYQLNIQFFELADGKSQVADPHTDLISANEPTENRMVEVEALSEKQE